MAETILISGYTRREAKGIYAVDLNKEEKQLENARLLIEEENPTYLAQDEKGHLYSVGSENGQGGIAAFRLENDTLSLLNHVVSEGAPLCYVAVDEEKELVYGSNYHLGQLRIYKRLENGELELMNTLQHSGSGPNENQQSAHIHYSDLTPDKRLVVCDLGSDEVVVYDVETTGNVEKVSTYHSAPGAGSRHLVFHPLREDVAYLFCELNSTIEVLEYNKENGEFACLQTISTIPETHTTFNGGAAIRMSSDGRFVYASNRGHDSIVSYKVSGNGRMLELLDFTPVEGKTPRDFNFSLDETFLIVANQDSDNVTLFSRNKENGFLTLQQKDFAVPEGTCVLPLFNGYL